MVVSRIRYGKFHAQKQCMNIKNHPSFASHVATGDMFIFGVFSQSVGCNPTSPTYTPANIPVPFDLHLLGHIIVMTRTVQLSIITMFLPLKPKPPVFATGTQT